MKNNLIYPLIKTGSFLKKAGLAALGLIPLSGVLAPAPALAAGWDPNEIVESAGGTAGVHATKITRADVIDWVRNITNFLVGIAIGLFVLRVVLTALNQWLFANADSSDKFNLTKIPLVGAYKGSENATGFNWWNDCFKHFVVQLAIIAGVWIIVQFLMGVILWVFGFATQPDNTSN